MDYYYKVLVEIILVLSHVWFSLTGVFTISDDLLTDASNFTITKDEELPALPASSVVSKIEETLRSASAVEE